MNDGLLEIPLKGKLFHLGLREQMFILRICHMIKLQIIRTNNFLLSIDSVPGTVLSILCVIYTRVVKHHHSPMR